MQNGSSVDTAESEASSTQASRPRDVRIFGMRLKQFDGGKDGVKYYNEGREHGVVGIGWTSWVSQSFLKELGSSAPSARGKLVRAILKGLTDVDEEPPDVLTEGWTFPKDRVAVLSEFEGLQPSEAIAFRDLFVQHDSIEDYEANQMACFLGARTGDVVVLYEYESRTAGQERYHVGRFSSRVLRPPENAGNILPFGTNGHVLRSVEWEAEKLDHAGLERTVRRLGLPDSFPSKSFGRATIKIHTDGWHWKAEHLDQTHPSAHQERSMQTLESSAAPGSLAGTLHRSQNLILEGVPGTGKTFAIGHEICGGWKDVAGKPLGGRGEGPWAITLHPATSYEDFVEGLRPVQQGSASGDDQPGPARAEAKAVKSYAQGSSGESIEDDDALRHERYFHIQLPGIHFDTPSAGFAMQDGLFVRVCAHAVNHPKEHFVVLLDEINRCNVPKVLGDLLTTLERSKRARWEEQAGGGHWDLKDCQVVTLPGSKRLFFVPDNVFVVATMNTTDRSVAPLDAALRRRFAFHRCWPLGFGEQSGVDTVAVGDVLKLLRAEAGMKNDDRGVFEESVRAWAELNVLLQKYGGPDAMLGHSYLFDLARDLKRKPATWPAATPDQVVRHHWTHHILPQLGDSVEANNLGIGEAIGGVLEARGGALATLHLPGALQGRRGGRHG